MNDSSSPSLSELEQKSAPNFQHYSQRQGQGHSMASTGIISVHGKNAITSLLDMNK